jgi:hypothetical protein
MQFSKKKRRIIKIFIRKLLNQNEKDSQIETLFNKPFSLFLVVTRLKGF